MMPDPLFSTAEIVCLTVLTVAFIILVPLFALDVLGLL